MIRILRTAAAAAAGIGFITIGPVVPAQGAPASDPNAPVVVVLDTSGSMNTQTSIESIRIDAARSAVLALVNSLRNGDTYGLINYPGGKQVNGCTIGNVVTELGPLDHAPAVAQIRLLEPDGNTPTAPALRHAAAELRAKDFTRGTIVLVSDGESNCGGDPCEDAAALRTDGFDVVVNTVGFDISGQGETELRCIADATGGRYFPANGSNLPDQVAKANGGFMEIDVDMPSRLPVVAGTSSATGTSVRATVTNTGSKTASDVRISLTIGETGRVLVVRPVLFAGNIAPGESQTRTFTVRPDQTYEPDPLAWTVVATAQNTPPASLTGTTRIDSSLSKHDLGSLLNTVEHVAVLGDSYSSGEGAGNYSAGTHGEASNWCHRSGWAYAPVLFGSRATSIIACSGAVTRDLTAQQKSRDTLMVPQLLALRAKAVGPESPDAIFLTLGGNDIGFGDVVTTCLVLSNCHRAAVQIADRTVVLGQYYLSRARAVSTDLLKSLQGVDAAANDSRAVAARGGRVAPIIVLPYVRIVPETSSDAPARSGCFVGFSSAEVAWMNQLIDRLNQSIRWAVGHMREAGRPVYYVDDVVGAFQPNHSICEKTSSFAVYDSLDRSFRLGGPRALDPERRQELAHPNSDGYRAIARAIATWSRSQATVESAPAPPWESRTQNGPSWWQRTNQRLWGTKVPGGAIDVSVGGYADGTTVVFTIESTPHTLGTATANRDGVASLSTWLPRDLPPGHHSIESAGIDGNGELRVVRFDVRLSRPGTPIALTAASFGLLIMLAIGSTNAATALRRKRSSRRSAKASR